MSYRIDEFDGVPLPLGVPRYPNDPAPAESSIRRTTGGYYDTRGDYDSLPASQTLVVTATASGVTEYLTDETGDILTDETGDPLIAGEAQAMLRAQIVSIAEKMRKVGPLWRTRIDDSVRQWKKARFSRMVEITTSRNLYHQELACSFESLMAHWHAETVTSVTASATAAVPASLTIENPGSTIEDAVLTVTRTSGTLTSVEVSCAALDIAWTWTGTLASGDALVVDDGTQSIVTDEGGAYDGLTLDSSHLADTWLSIPFGSYVLVVTVLGGNADLSFDYYVQSP